MTAQELRKRLDVLYGKQFARIGLHQLGIAESGGGHDGHTGIERLEQHVGYRLATRRAYEQIEGLVVVLCVRPKAGQRDSRAAQTLEAATFAALWS